MDGFWSRARRRWPLLVVAYVVAWTVPGLITTAQLTISYGIRGDYPDLGLLLRVSLPGWYIWALLAPAIAWAVWRWPFERSRWPRVLALHLAASVVAAAAWVAMAVLVRRAFSLPGTTDAGVLLTNAVGASLLTYGVIALGVHALRAHLEGRDRELRAVQLAGELSQARLRALSARLQPHFLFNTMHAISAFVSSDPEKAETMLAHLADLLRMVLDAPEVDVVPLRRELDFAERYLALQEIRLGDRLRVDVDVRGDPAGVGVPLLLIQPLIENAVEHGVASRRGPGSVTVRCTIAAGRVRFEIRDDGPGLPEAFDLERTGRIGLATTAARLRAQYGDDHTFDVGNGDEVGVVIRIDVPARPVASSQSPGVGLATSLAS